MHSFSHGSAGDGGEHGSVSPMTSNEWDSAAPQQRSPGTHSMPPVSEKTEDEEVQQLQPEGSMSLLDL